MSLIQSKRGYKYPQDFITKLRVISHSKEDHRQREYESSNQENPRRDEDAHET